LVSIQNAKVLSVKREIHKLIRGKNMSSLQKTIEKIKSLETEKKSLLLEMENLKKMADAKATALENDVVALRDEIKSLKILMGPEQPNPNQLKVS